LPTAWLLRFVSQKKTMRNRIALLKVVLDSL
jgi:hypothetical protein